jgi:nucleoid-associated protein YgaU
MRRIALLGLVAADGLTLVTAAPSRSLPGHVAALSAWVATAGADEVAAELAAAGLWLAALWTAVGLASIALARLPGCIGTAADRLARAVLPHAVYRLAAGAAGAGLLLAPVAASAQPPRTPVPAPAWPTSSTLPAPAWPLGPESSAPRHAPAPDRQPPAPSEVVTVRPGDSLWTIAAASLAHATPARVAAEWPRWFAANRAVIGADPDHLVPGEVLTSPRSRSSHPSEEAQS